MKMRFDFNVAKEDFMKMDIDEAILSKRAKGALRRAGFETVGQVINLVNSENDLKGRSSMKKIRNLGEKTAHSIIPQLYGTYLGMLDDKDCAKVVENFVEKNKILVERCPEFAVITLSPKLFRNYFQNFEDLC